VGAIVIVDGNVNGVKVFCLGDGGELSGDETGAKSGVDVGMTVGDCAVDVACDGGTDGFFDEGTDGLFDDDDDDDDDGRTEFEGDEVRSDVGFFDAGFDECSNDGIDGTHIVGADEGAISADG